MNSIREIHKHLHFLTVICDCISFQHKHLYILPIKFNFESIMSCMSVALTSLTNVQVGRVFLKMSLSVQTPFKIH